MADEDASGSSLPGLGLACVAEDREVEHADVHREITKPSEEGRREPLDPIWSALNALNRKRARELTHDSGNGMRWNATASMRGRGKKR